MLLYIVPFLLTAIMNRFAKAAQPAPNAPRTIGTVRTRPACSLMAPSSSQASDLTEIPDTLRSKGVGSIRIRQSSDVLAKKGIGKITTQQQSGMVVNKGHGKRSWESVATPGMAKFMFPSASSTSTASASSSSIRLRSTTDEFADTPSLVGDDGIDYGVSYALHGSGHRLDQDRVRTFVARGQGKAKVNNSRKKAPPLHITNRGSRDRALEVAASDSLMHEAAKTYVLEWKSVGDTSGSYFNT